MLSDMRPIEIFMCSVVLRQGDSVEDMHPIEIFMCSHSATRLSFLSMCKSVVFLALSRPKA